MATAKKFKADDLQIHETLGEGAYGKVRLCTHMPTGERIAVKIINITYKGVEPQDLKKEMVIHKSLDHQHIVRFYGFEQIDIFVYMFLEYASGGELFDAIEPDYGMNEELAHIYFKQLINAVEFMHKRGVTHRDIKPENILLDQYGNIKICDFGLSTIFRTESKERKLNRRCGTASYSAPEVFSGEFYDAEPADLWSCAIVLVAMLAGCLPWDEPIMECEDYAHWVRGDLSCNIWHRIPAGALGLLRKMLSVNPAQRPTIEEIKRDPWFNMQTGITMQVGQDCVFTPENMTLEQYMQCLALHAHDDDDMDEALSAGRKRLLTDLTNAERGGKRMHMDDEAVHSRDFISLSQNVAQLPTMTDDLDQGNYFSQPTRFDDMAMTQGDLTQFTQTQTQTHARKLDRRITRFIIKDEKLLMENLTMVLADVGVELLQIKGDHRLIRCRKVDRHKAGQKRDVRFEVRLFEMGGGFILIDFKRSRGDGFMFKQAFKAVREHYKRESKIAREVRSVRAWYEPQVHVPVLPAISLSAAR